MKRRHAALLLISALLLLGSAAFAQESGGMTPGLPVVGPDVTIRFAALVGERSAACGMIYSGVGAEGSTITLNDFRFFVSNVRLINSVGDEVPVELTQDGQWQYENVTLLDFEDGSGMCGEAGNAELNDKVIGTVPEGEYTGLVFDLGVPFALNHLDTSTAPAPLNIPAMWWNWQFGYKFVRIDMMTPGGQTPAWLIHLGSTGCEAADTSSAPEEPCANSNIVTVRFDAFNAVENFVIADAASLLSGVNLNESVPEPPGCMSGPDDPDCVSLFPGFGLDLATGAMAADGTQAFFRAD